ncbi:glycoside hydrolase family 5 protein [Cytidiella melzeri]|nr:glycoside hydrolase family 5 protein [Cytidiella melzeri]
MRPRFLGRALDDEGHGPRQSYASSGNSLNIADDAQSSVYGLNPSGGQNRDTAYYSLNYRDDPHDSDFHRSTPDISPKPSSPYLSEKRAAYGAPNVRSRKRALILGALALVAVIIIVVVVAIYFTVIKPHNSSGSTSGGVAHDSSSSSTASSASPSSTGKPVALVVTGGDGSLVTTDKGTTFTYRNSYGGYWYWDPTDPFNNGARAQAWSPALNESFEYGTDTIRGVNLGGWLNTEPVSFFTPALYEKYLNSSIVAIDEWTLSQAMTADTAGGGLKQLEDHYDTFITEQDFAQIAAAGLNYVRIPLPYWAIETRGSEPFLAKTCWTYFLKAVQWARKYGIRINLDLHALPGSQNGWNHSGKYGSINVLNGPMGFANAQRSLDYIRIIAEFISQPEYSTVVTMFGVTNEPQAPIFGQENLARYYLQAYNNVRTASGVGENKGPFISFHEGFAGLSGWNGYFTNSDRVSYDIHPYVCFGAQSTDGYDTRATEPCTSWGANQNKSMTANGLTTAGEFSNAINDCGLYVNGVNLGTRFDGTYKLGGPWPKQGDCDSWTDYQSWTPAMKQDIQNFALASMDALQNWFFWTWKIGNSSVTGKVEAPAWSYSLGLQEGWMPKDPRTSSGTCGNTDPWQPPLESWMTGGAGADQIPATFSSSFAWPPTSISNAGAVTLLPSYTQTGTIPTLPAPSFTSASSVSVGNGWENAADNVGIAVAIPTCSYLDPWVGTVAPPSPLCSGAAKREPVPQPTITPPPS